MSFETTAATGDQRDYENQNRYHSDANPIKHNRFLGKFLLSGGSCRRFFLGRGISYRCTTALAESKLGTCLLAAIREKNCFKNLGTATVTELCVVTQFLVAFRALYKPDDLSGYLI